MPTKITRTDKRVSKTRLRNELAVLVLGVFIGTAALYAWKEGVRRIHTHIISPTKHHQMPGLNFTYYIHTDANTKKVTLVLYDHSSKGGMSLTNGIEKAIEHVCLENNLKTAHVDCVYCDSEGKWDGFDPRKCEFIHLNAERAEDAIEQLKQKTE